MPIIFKPRFDGKPNHQVRAAVAVISGQRCRCCQCCASDLEKLRSLCAKIASIWVPRDTLGDVYRARLRMLGVDVDGR